MSYVKWESALRGAVAAIMLSVLVVPAVAQTVDPAALAELRRMIAGQQKQMAAQAAVLDRLRRQVEVLSRLAREAKATAERGAAATATTVAATGKPAVAKADQEGISLAISGQVNRGMLFIDDGANGEIFHVDNDHSSTRLRMVGKGRVSNDLMIGAEIEVQMESNSTGSVSQDDNDNGVGGASFTERKLEVFLDSKRLGKLWLGQGDSASNGTSEVDLSGTTVIAYSTSPEQMAGGIKFFSPATRAFGPAIKSVFSNFDGLSRDDRIRYDTPKFGGFGLSASHVSGGAYDVALRYAASYDAFKIAAAIAFADPGSISATTENQHNGSFSVLHDSGFNVSFAAGRAAPERTGSDPVFAYGKLGYIARIFDIGETAFAIDFTRADNIAQDGDEATSFGFAAVQNLKRYGTQFFAGVRNHGLDRTGADFDDVFTTLAGARVKF